MKLSFVIAALWIFLSACTQTTEHTTSSAPFDAKGKEAKIYTTADSTALRLSPTGSKTFQAAGQPLETEVAIFVNPAKTFQSFNIHVGDRWITASLHPSTVGTFVW